MGDGTASDRGDRLRTWLRSPQVVDADGRVWSWHDDAQPGYPYPEAGGLWLSWAARTLAPDDRGAASVARWLAHELDADRVGRDGIAYAFDLGVVVRGCLAWAEARRVAPGPATIAGALKLCDAITAKRATWGATADERWSTRFGDHHLKLLFALAAIERAGVCAVDRARDVLRETCVGVREPYLHARLYALEGRMLAGAPIDAELDALAQLQRPNGGLPAWSNGEGPTRSDATAQAIRLWSCCDHARWSHAIRRGLAFLASLTTHEGVRYDDTSSHRNTWCTLFALQAMQPAAHFELL
ncbi:MAG TPA: hypothetical protein VG755_13830 [Nannocystaceae bacterium]|nr:hypothetical protein [Nannocystaceae bacterium]